MAHEYQLTADPRTIFRALDQAYIPTDPANHDYAEYLAWVDAGNTPDPLPPLTAQQVAMNQLIANDALMFRALELLIDVLLAKNVIVATDFSVQVRNLYQQRKALRVTAGVP